MTFAEELKSLGVDTDEGLDRVMGDKDLYEMMLGMFADAVKNNPIAPEDFSGDPEKLIKTVHMLKGTAGNLSLTPHLRRVQCRPGPAAGEPARPGRGGV